MEILAKNIKKLRIEKRFSQKELAEKIGTQQTTIARIEKNLSNPTIPQLLALADLFDVSIDSLFDRKAKKNLDEKIDTALKEYIEEYIKSYVNEYLEETIKRN